MDSFALLGPFAGIVVLLAALGLVYIWLGCRCESLGREIVALEVEQGELERQFDKAECRWCETKAPRSLERALARNNIRMEFPRANQVVRIVDKDVRSRRLLSEADDARRVARLDRVTQHE